MKCTICKLDVTRPGKATVVLERGQTTVVIKDVPAEYLRENCGKYYPTEDLTAKVVAMAEDAVRHNVEIEVLRFAA